MTATETAAATAATGTGAAVGAPFVPELGQWGFSTTEWQQLRSPEWLHPGLELIAQAIATGRGEQPTPPDPGDDLDTETLGPLLTSNYGAESYESDVFAMRSYCWCDGDTHPEQCPANFEHKPSGLVITWYKHALRGRSQNATLTPGQWLAIVAACITDATSSLPPGAPDPDGTEVTESGEACTCPDLGPDNWKTPHERSCPALPAAAPQ